jgi:hypothetical protein
MQTKAASVDFSFSRFQLPVAVRVVSLALEGLGPAFMEERTVVRAGPEAGIEFDQPISIVDAHCELMQDVEAEHLTDRHPRVLFNCLPHTPTTLVFTAKNKLSRPKQISLDRIGLEFL